MLIKEIKVLYEDNHLLVVEKPPNMPVQRDISGDGDLLSYLKTYIKDKYNKPGNVFIGLVHRLDRPVGGVMVFARTSKAAARLSEQIRSRTIRKTYIAVAEGLLDSLYGTLRDYLYKDWKSNTVKVVSNNIKGSQEAILQYSVISHNSGNTLLKIDLETGRPHQIRVQMSNIGHPLTGDIKYGAKNQKGFTDNIALWSYKLEFNHPVRDETLTFTSIPPEQYPWDIFKEDISRLSCLPPA
jgi:23S rRNA pseudouridine1911/1915/1917 synthase